MKSSTNKRDLVFLPEFLEDLAFWVSTDRKMALRILKLIDAVSRDPFIGIGKPEPLKHLEVAQWSRRINEEHRLVYEVSDANIEFHQARYHYLK
jgi:toxin YoeB